MNPFFLDRSDQDDASKTLIIAVALALLGAILPLGGYLWWVL